MKARVIALYLPQYHPIPENDEWWGKGFTEWYNVARAKPLFRGHYQPKIPTELGFYDLRLPEAREAQAELARWAGIEGFCYWHYWFGNGRQLLERPFNEVLTSGKPDFPFCLGWANHTWSNKTWDKSGKNNDSKVLMEQTYPGIEDHTLHFNTLLPAFKDHRYIKVDNKPLFLVFNPSDIPATTEFVDIWNSLAQKNGLEGIHFVAVGYNGTIRSAEGKFKLRGNLDDVQERYDKLLNRGYNAICSQGMIRAQLISKGSIKTIISKIFADYFNLPDKYNQAEINKHLFVPEERGENIYPTLIPNWDRTARAKNSSLFYNSTPQNFEVQLRTALDLVKDKEEDHRIIFLKSWNEWGEGNYVEPDQKYGRGYLEVLRRLLH